VSRFVIEDLYLSGLKRVERRRLGDNRGFFSRVFCAEELSEAGWVKPIVQLNHTYTAKRGAVRGLHFQRPPHAEMKLVSCLRGEVWDVAVDLRQDSPTFLHWQAEALSAENGRALLIPEGFAHGFQAMTDEVELLYCHSAAHAPSAEAGVNCRDQRLTICWPLPLTELSIRDSGLPSIGDGFEGVRI
jgi:dTDP-4-dehydrorhamnose 3,5-epimerase